MNHVVYEAYKDRIGGQVVGAFNSWEDAMSTVQTLNDNRDLKSKSDFIYMYNARSNNKALANLPFDITAEHLQTGDKKVVGQMKSIYLAGQALQSLIWNDTHKEEWLTFVK